MDADVKHRGSKDGWRQSLLKDGIRGRTDEVYRKEAEL